LRCLSDDACDFCLSILPVHCRIRRGSNLGYTRLLVDRAGIDDAT
jgi:hypothetical protein